MSFRTKTPAAAVTPPPTAPQAVASPTDLMGSLARRRRLSGGRNGFAPSQTSSAAQGANTVTGVPS